MAAKKKRAPRRPRITTECTIPPEIPDTALPNLMFKRDRLAEKAIREYVEWQAPDTKVTHAERVTTEFVMGRKLEGWDVRTDKERWWVITQPTNLYPQKLFPSLDYTISFHVGVTTRMMSQPESGVPEAEQAILLPAWRRWEQAAEALQEADEAEEFQSVGMRCRECLIAMVKSVADPEMVKPGNETPKRSDVIAWCELIADHVAHGQSAEYVRKYLKTVSKSGWQLVGWLTHASGATQADAALAIEITQHVLSTFGTAVFRHRRGVPDQCPECGSYRIGLRLRSPDNEHEGVPGCLRCGWIAPHNG
jgi:hypothetical protein